MKKIWGLLRDEKTQTYIEPETGRVIPVERLDEYAQEKLDAALERLATAYVQAHNRAGTNPL